MYTQPNPVLNGFGVHPLTFNSQRFFPDGRIMYVPKGNSVHPPGSLPHPSYWSIGLSDWSTYEFYPVGSSLQASNGQPSDHMIGQASHGNGYQNIGSQNTLPPQPTVSQVAVNHVEDGKYTIRLTGNIPPHCVFWDPYHISPLRQFHENQMRNGSEQQSSGYSSTPSSTGHSNHHQQYPLVQQSGAEPTQGNVSNSPCEVIVGEPDEQQPVKKDTEAIKNTEMIEMKVGLVTELVEGIRGLNKHYGKLEERLENIEAGMLSVGSIVRDHLERRQKDVKDAQTATDGSAVKLALDSPICVTVEAKVEANLAQQNQTVPKERSDTEVSATQLEVQKSTIKVSSTPSVPANPPPTFFSEKSMFSATEFPILEKSTSPPPPYQLTGRPSGVNKSAIASTSAKPASSSITSERHLKTLTLSDFLVPVKKSQNDQKLKTSQTIPSKLKTPDIPKPVPKDFGFSNFSGSASLNGQNTTIPIRNDISLRNQTKRNYEQRGPQDFVRPQISSGESQLIPLVVEKKISSGSSSTVPSSSLQGKPNVLVLEVPKTGSAPKSQNSKMNLKTTTNASRNSKKKIVSGDVAPVFRETPQAAKVGSVVVKSPESSGTSSKPKDKSVSAVETPDVLELVKTQIGPSCSSSQERSKTEIDSKNAPSCSDAPEDFKTHAEVSEVPEVEQKSSDSKEGAPQLSRKQRRQLELEEQRFAEKERKKNERKERERRNKERKEMERQERLQSETPPNAEPEDRNPSHLPSVIYSMKPGELTFKDILANKGQELVGNLLTTHETIHKTSIKRYIIEANLRRVDERFRIRFEAGVTEQTRLIYDIVKWTPEKQEEYEKSDDPWRFVKKRIEHFNTWPDAFKLVLFLQNLMESNNDVLKFDSYFMGKASKDYNDADLLARIGVQYMTLVSGTNLPELSNILPDGSQFVLY